MATKTQVPSKSVPVDANLAREAVFNTFRRWGYLESTLDPLGKSLIAEPIPEPFTDGPHTDEARRAYAGTVAVEFMHISDKSRREWIQQRMENASPTPHLNETRTLELLTRADLFEQVIQSRYLGTKRFSLEGLTALIPFLDELLQQAASHGVNQAMLGMSHRGRLNVMVNIIGKSTEDIFTKFEDVDPRSTLGGGDVKYHIGATGTFHAAAGDIDIHLVSNPSHLEAVDPVVIGRARAKQTRAGDQGEDQVLPIVIHGDAAFAGQGIWAESLNLASIPGFTVGGSIHIIANNLLGFTAEPRESNASRFASDIAKRLPIPIFHVNAEDADAVLRVADIAADYRQTFHSDVVVDLIGYRRHGHSEVDDPTVTQPLLYARIKDHPPLYKKYARQIGVDPAPLVTQYQAEFLEAQKQAKTHDRVPKMAHLPHYWDAYPGGAYKKEYEVKTGLPIERITEIGLGLTQYPSDFHIHPKVKKLLEQRAEMARGEKPFDYGMAEAVAFGSLLTQGTPVRLTGQDSQRGTFNQRHSVLVDIEDESRYIPLQHLAPAISKTQARFEVYNSMLSEAACLGFEYGYARDYPETLVLWEAQFGDFANGAQIIIDQFIASGEDKWGLLSGVTLLLPHGYEGGGPEHSSARVERYLQLAAHDNMQICQPSTAAQYFHLLRRQAMRAWRKPLVVFTPKSMLRHPDANSPIEDFAREGFRNVLPETEIKNAKRLLLCTGKIGHQLRVERERRQKESGAPIPVGVVFLEQLHPFPEEELRAAILEHPGAELVWVQEEPSNMGALTYVKPHLRRIAGNHPVTSVKRSASASVATGSAKAHELEERTLLDLAFGHLSS
jgi:2-oxoglutarate dehydrogenase E1 component